jgi:hypothetical protein
MVNWKQRVVAGIVLLAAVAAILTVGYSLGKDHNDALVNFLREKNQMLEAGEKTLRAEVEALKLELQQSRPPQSSSAGTSVETQAPAIGTLYQKTSLPEKPDEERSQIVSISPGKTAQPFGGAILITFQGLRFEGSPPRYRVDATLGKVGKPSKEIQGITPGHVLIYEGFEVRLTDTDPFSVKFLVTRL